jgi:hypothetical protein
MNTPRLDAIRERIRQVKVELARLRMAERLARMEARATTPKGVRRAK